MTSLNVLGVLIQISLGVMVAMSSLSLSYSEVSSCDVVSSDSVSGLALDVVAAGRLGDESGDEGGQKVVVFCHDAILYFWLLIQ